MLGVGAGIWQPVTLGAKGAPPLAGASFDMNFGQGAYLGATPANLSVNRASTGYAKTAAGSLVSFGNNVARITDLGLLVEEGRTNIVLRSQELSTSPNAVLNATVQADQTAAPDGTNTADQLTDDATSGQHYLNQGITYALGTYAISVFAKAGTDSKLQISPSATAFTVAPTPHANFDLATGTVSSTSVGGLLVGAYIEPYANGWYRCTIVATADAAIAANTFIARINSTVSPRIPTYAGTGTTIYLWGYQIELIPTGSSASSYIPTTSAFVARALDVVTLSGTAFSSWYTGGTTGTIYAEADANQKSIGGINWLLDITNGGSNEEIFLLNNNAQFNAQSKVGGAPQADIVGGSWPYDNSSYISYRKSCFAYNTNDFEYVAGGASLGTDVAGTVPSVSQINFGTRPGASSAFNGYIRRVAYFPTRLTQAAMILLTEMVVSDAILDLWYFADTYKGALSAAHANGKASVSYIDNQAGVWSSSAAGGVPRTDRGLVTRTQRTNSVRNNSGTGGVAFVSGPTNWNFGGGIFGNGITAANLTGYGTENGMDYVEISGSGTNIPNSLFRANFDTPGNVAADSTTNKFWEQSFFYRFVGTPVGVGSVRAVTLAFQSDNTTVTETFAQDTRVNLPTTYERIAANFTVANALTTTLRSGIDVVATGTGAIPYNFVIRIAWPQLELASAANTLMATNPIRTTAASVIHGADTVRLLAPAMAAFAAQMSVQGSAVWQGSFQDIAYTANAFFISISDGTSNNEIAIYRNAGGLNYLVNSGSISQVALAGAMAITSGQRFKVGMAWLGSNFQFWFNGVSVGTLGSGTVPAVSQFAVNTRGDGSFISNACCERVTLYPTRLTAQNMVALTT